MQRRPRQHDKSHLQFIRGLPCVVCGDNTSTEAAHVRMVDPSVAKPMTGMGIKPDDKYTVPLCGRCHRKQHGMREFTFWQDAGIDPVKKALALYCVSGDHERGSQIVRAQGF